MKIKVTYQISGLEYLDYYMRLKLQRIEEEQVEDEESSLELCLEEAAPYFNDHSEDEKKYWGVELEIVQNWYGDWGDGTLAFFSRYGGEVIGRNVQSKHNKSRSWDEKKKDVQHELLHAAGLGETDVQVLEGRGHISHNYGQLGTPGAY